MPILIRLVRAAIALAMLSGADNSERRGSKCSSASHITSSPSRSAASTWSIASSKASLSDRPGSDGNSWNMPNSMTGLAFLLRLSGTLAKPARPSQARLLAPMPTPPIMRSSANQSATATDAERDHEPRLYRIGQHGWRVGPAADPRAQDPRLRSQARGGGALCRSRCGADPERAGAGPRKRHGDDLPADLGAGARRACSARAASPRCCGPARSGPT